MEPIMADLQSPECTAATEASELVRLLASGLEDDLHSATDVVKVITKMALRAKRKLLVAIQSDGSNNARSDGNASDPSVPLSLHTGFPVHDDDDEDDGDDLSPSPSDSSIVNEQDWGHAGLYHNLLQGVISWAAKLTPQQNAADGQQQQGDIKATTPNQTRHPIRGGGGATLLHTTTINEMQHHNLQLLSGASDEDRASIRSLVDFIEHAAQMILALSDAFHPMVAKLIVELCFEYISNPESMPCAHSWLLMLVGPIVVGLPSLAASWDSGLIAQAVARHPPKASTGRLLKDPAMLVGELRFALARFLSSYVASERMLDGLSGDGVVAGGSVLGSDSGRDTSLAQPPRHSARSPHITHTKTSTPPLTVDLQRYDRLSILALGREAEKRAADDAKSHGASEQQHQGPPLSIAPSAVSPLSQAALELHNHHHGAQRHSSTPGGGISVPRLDIPRIFKNRGGSSTGAGGTLDLTLDASPVIGHHKDTHQRHHGRSTASSLKPPSIDFMGPHVGDSLIRQYGGIAEHMRLRWKQHSTSTRDKDKHGQGPRHIGEHQNVAFVEDPLHLQQLVVCGHKLGQLFGTVDAKMLLRLKKDHEGLVAAHELEATSSMWLANPSSSSFAPQSTGVLGQASAQMSTSMQHQQSLGNSMALRLSLSRCPSAGRDDHLFEDLRGSISQRAFGVEHIGGAFEPLPCQRTTNTTTADVDSRKQHSCAARSIFRELAVIALQGLSGWDSPVGAAYFSGLGCGGALPSARGTQHTDSVQNARLTPNVRGTPHHRPPGGGGGLLLPASLAHHGSSTTPTGATMTMGRRDSCSSMAQSDGPATIVAPHSPSRAMLLDGSGTRGGVPNSVSPSRTCDDPAARPSGIALDDENFEPGPRCPPPAASPPPAVLFPLVLPHGGRCALALLRRLRYESSAAGFATPLLLGFQLLDSLESRNVAFLHDLTRSIASFALDGESFLFSLFREPTSLVGYPTLSGPVTDKVPQDAFLELWVSVINSLLEVTSPVPYDAIAWCLASLCHVLRHLPTSCAYLIQTAVVCANTLHEVLDVLRRDVSFHYSFACCVHYVLELFDMFLGIQKPSEMLIAVFVSLFASTSQNPVNRFLKTYVKRVATAEDAWILFHPQPLQTNPPPPQQAASMSPGGHASTKEEGAVATPGGGGTPGGTSDLSSPNIDESIVAGAGLLLRRRLSSSSTGRGATAAAPTSQALEDIDIQETLFWPNAFHVERHRVRLLKHYRTVSRFLSAQHHGSYLSIAHETQGEHPLDFILNPVEGIALVILSDVAPQTWLGMQLETLKLIEEVACQAVVVSPLLQQSGWVATYTRFLYLAFLEAYHSHAYSARDKYVTAFSTSVLRALSALCQQNPVARSWALKLGIVRTLIQEIDLEQSVSDIRERQLKKVREAKQQLLHRLSSNASLGDGDDEDERASGLVESKERTDPPRDIRTPPSPLVHQPSPSALSSSAPEGHSLPPDAALPPPVDLASDDSSAQMDARNVSEFLASPLVMHSDDETVTSGAPMSSSGSIVVDPLPTASSRPPLFVPKLSLALAPPPLYYTSNGDTGATVEATMSNMSFVKSGSFAFASTSVDESGTNDQESTPIEMLEDGTQSGTSSDDEENGVAPTPAPEPQNAVVVPSGRPPLFVPKLSLALAPPPLYYTSNGDTGATVEATMSNMSFVKSGSFALQSPSSDEVAQLVHHDGGRDDDDGLESSTSSGAHEPHAPPVAHEHHVVTLEPCSDDDGHDLDDRDQSEPMFLADMVAAPQEQESCSPAALGSSGSVPKQQHLLMPILVSNGRSGSFDVPQSAGGLYDAAEDSAVVSIVAQVSGATRLDGVRPARIAFPTPASPAMLSSGESVLSIDSSKSIDGAKVIGDDGGFSTPGGVVYIPPLAMTQALRGGSTPHGGGGARSPSARASRTVRLVEPTALDDGAEFELPQRSIREASPDARAPPTAHRASASPRLGFPYASSSTKPSAADITCDEEVQHATSFHNASQMERTNSVLSRRSEMCSPTESTAPGVYPLQLVLNEAKFAAHQRSIRRIYMDRDIQVELLYLILNLVVSPNGTLDPVYTSTFTVRGGHRVQALFHLHMHLNHDANAPAVHALWDRLVLQGGDSSPPHNATAGIPQTHSGSTSMHDRGMRLLVQMTCFRTNLGTTYERQEKVGVGGYGAVMAAVISLDPTGSGGGGAHAHHHQHHHIHLPSPHLASSECSTSIDADSGPNHHHHHHHDNDAAPEGSSRVGLSNERVAVKLAPVPHHIDDRETLVSFFNEVLLLTHIQDIPESVRLLDCGCDGTQYAIVMPLYHCSARDWRLRLGPVGGLPHYPPGPEGPSAPFSSSSSGVGKRSAFAQCLGVFSTLLRALCKVHQRRMVHHDLKLDNVFLELDDEDTCEPPAGGAHLPAAEKTTSTRYHRCRIKLGDWGEGEILPVVGRILQQNASTSRAHGNNKHASSSTTWALDGMGAVGLERSGTPVPLGASLALAGNSLVGYEHVATRANNAVHTVHHTMVSNANGSSGALFQTLKQLFQKPKGTECIRSPEALLPHKYLPTAIATSNHEPNPLPSSRVPLHHREMQMGSSGSTSTSSPNFPLSASTSTPAQHVHNVDGDAFAEDVALIVQKSDVWAVACLLYELLIGEALFGEPDFGQFMHRITSTDPGVLLGPEHLLALRSWGGSGEEKGNHESRQVGGAMEGYLRYLLERDPLRRPTMHQALEYWEEMLSRMGWTSEAPVVHVTPPPHDAVVVSSPVVSSPVGGPTQSPRTPGIVRTMSRRSLKALQQAATLGASMSNIAVAAAHRSRTLPWSTVLDPVSLDAALHASTSGETSHHLASRSSTEACQERCRSSAPPLYHVAPSLAVTTSSRGMHHTNTADLFVACGWPSADAVVLQCYNWGITHVFSLYKVSEAVRHFHYQDCQSTMEGVVRECTLLDHLYAKHVAQHAHAPTRQQAHHFLTAAAGGGGGALEASVSFDVSSPPSPGRTGLLSSSSTMFMGGGTSNLMSRSSSNLSVSAAVPQNPFVSSPPTGSRAGFHPTAGRLSDAAAALPAGELTALLESVPPHVVHLAHRLCHCLPAQYHDAVMKRGCLLIPSFMVDEVDYAIVGALIVLSVTHRLPLLSALFHVRQHCPLDPNRINLIRTLQTTKVLLSISSLRLDPPSVDPLQRFMSSVSAAPSSDATAAKYPASVPHRLLRTRSSRVDDSILLTRVSYPMLYKRVASTPLGEVGTGVVVAQEWCRCVCGLCVYMVPPLESAAGRRHFGVLPHENSASFPSASVLSPPYTVASEEHFPIQQLAQQRISTALKRATDSGVSAATRASTCGPQPGLSRSGTPMQAHMAAAASAFASFTEPPLSHCAAARSFLVPQAVRVAMQGAMKFFFVRLMALYGMQMARRIFSARLSTGTGSARDGVATYRVDSVEGMLPRDVLDTLHQGTALFPSHSAAPPSSSGEEDITTALNAKTTVRQHRNDPLHDGSSSSSPVESPTGSGKTTKSTAHPPPPWFSIGQWEQSRIHVSSRGGELLEFRCVRCQTPTHYAFPILAPSGAGASSFTDPSKQGGVRHMSSLQEDQTNATNGRVVVLTWADFPVHQLRQKASLSTFTSPTTHSPAPLLTPTTATAVEQPCNDRPLSLASSITAVDCPADNNNDDDGGGGDITTEWANEVEKEHDGLALQLWMYRHHLQ